jgi:hypothetical protein
VKDSFGEGRHGEKIETRKFYQWARVARTLLSAAVEFGKLVVISPTVPMVAEFAQRGRLGVVHEVMHWL